MTVSQENLVEQCGNEFDQLVNHMMQDVTNGDVDHELIKKTVGPDLHLLLDAVVSIKIVYMTKRTQALMQSPQIGADSFMPSFDKRD